MMKQGVTFGEKKYHKTCVRCGETFESGSPRALYCGEYRSTEGCQNLMRIEGRAKSNAKRRVGLVKNYGVYKPGKE